MASSAASGLRTMRCSSRSSRSLGSVCSVSRGQSETLVTSLRRSLDHPSALSRSRSTKLCVVARTGGAPYRPPGPRPAGARRQPSRGPRPGEEREDDGPPINTSIRSATLRLLGEDNAVLGIVAREEALAMAQQASLDLVLIAPEAEPPVARIMNYGKFRYEQQKKKREAQRKVMANRQEIKELKMRYNIGTGDYNVRLKQALRFLKDGDKVKVSAQFRGREMEFKELGIQLFERFANDVAEVGVVETKAQMEGKLMQMVLIPNKAALAKAAALEKKQQQKQAKELRLAARAAGLDADSEEESEAEESESEESEEGDAEGEEEEDGGSAGGASAEAQAAAEVSSSDGEGGGEAVAGSESSEEEVGSFTRPAGSQPEGSLLSPTR